MNRSPKTVLARTAFVAAVFVAGYFAGSAGQPVAEAQLGDALKAAGAAAAASAGGTGGVRMRRSPRIDFPPDTRARYGPRRT
jgi:hypothetical protein